MTGQLLYDLERLLLRLEKQQAPVLDQATRTRFHHLATAPRKAMHMDPFGRRRPVGDRVVPRVEALAQAVAERAVELAVSALDMNALLDRVDLNALLDRIDLNRQLARVNVEAVVDRVDVNAVIERIDIDELVEQTDLRAVIAASSSGVASDVLDAVRSQTVGLDEFIARWIGRLRRRPYTGPPGPADGLPAKAGS